STNSIWGASTITFVFACILIWPDCTVNLSRLLPSESLSAMVLASSSNDSNSPVSVRMIFRGGVESDPVSSFGSSPSPQKQPVQIGSETSAASNSIQTEAPTAGIVYTPTPTPAYGSAGKAQPVSTSCRTLGTIARSRPLFKGSVLFDTVPRNLPKK